MRLKTEIEIVINHEYNDMNDILNCIEEDISEAVGEKLNTLLGNNSNVSCTVINTERIRDNMKFTFNIDDVNILNRMDNVINRLQKFNPTFGERHIYKMMNEIFPRNLELVLALLENQAKGMEKDTK